MITTNSLKPTFNRRVVQQALADGLQLAFAIPDHPWLDSADGAAPQSEAQLAARITGIGAWKKRLPDLLQTLVALGRARQEGETWWAV